MSKDLESLQKILALLSRPIEEIG